MAENKIIAVDAMGGDNAPAEIIKGCVSALEVLNKEYKIVLVGREEIIREGLTAYKYDTDRLSIVSATETITNDESPAEAIRNKKNSSMVVGLNMLKKGEAGAFVSAGSTGALLTGATVIIGRMSGVARPALATIIPTIKDKTLLIDCGANVDSKPNYLEQYAKMGSVYMENILGINNPRVALINIGTEKEKGNQLTKEAYELLEKSEINFIGNIEGRDILNGVAQVVVCDAFVGNIILKLYEGVSSSLMNIIKKELMSSFVTKIGALLSRKAYKNIKKSFDSEEIGGAPFLGLKALVLKAHGSSKAKGIKNTVLQCERFIENEVIAKTQKVMKENSQK